PNDGAELYSFHRPRQRVAAKFSGPAFDVPSCLELRKNLLKEFDRQFFFRGQLTYLKHRPPELRGDAKIDKSSERIFAAFGNFHFLTLCAHTARSVTSTLAAPD